MGRYLCCLHHRKYIEAYYDFSNSDIIVDFFLAHKEENCDVVELKEWIPEKKEEKGEEK